jgi:deoxyribodipyrimidine photolyase-related protein
MSGRIRLNMPANPMLMRNLILILGDQLDVEAAVLKRIDPARDRVWMAEVHEEATHVWCHKTRLVLFFSAMRHFRDELRSRGLPVHYHELTDDPDKDRGASLTEVLEKDIHATRPERILLARPGDFRVLTGLKALAAKNDIPLEILQDGHFFASTDDFSAFVQSRKRVLMEDFYHLMRRKTGLLMDSQGKPVGGRWNYDQDNRRPLPKDIVKSLPHPRSFAPDAKTREVLAMVQARFPAHPGTCTDFDLPVTRNQALEFLDDFILRRLENFGTYEDAMLAGEPFLFHSRLSTCLNLRLLHPRECLNAALRAYENGQAPLNSVEGFVRQILGWREYIRGIYWLHMPGYQDLNALEHDLPMASFFWDGAVDMACVRDSMAHVLRHAYSHHIQRLMVLGLFALLAGVHPHRFHEWHMAMYADAVDWVSLPNALGMSQYGDGGIVGTKPYCATGKYIHRMGNYCPDCAYDPNQSTGRTACPFTALYWDFLDRHETRLHGNPRMSIQLANLQRRRRDRELTRQTRAAADAVIKRYFQ